MAHHSQPRLLVAAQQRSYGGTWLLVSVLSLPIALSLSEICSVYPTSAGAYYWCFRLAPPRYRLLLSWINGWLYTVGVWTISLSVTFGSAQMIVAGASIFHPEWVATPWQTSERNSQDLIFVGVTAFASIFVIFMNKLLPTIDILSAFWTLFGIIAILIGFSVRAAAGRRPASFALGHFDASVAGWTPGWAFFIGLLPPGKLYAPICLTNTSQNHLSIAYTYSAIGMITSMAEEVRDPAVQVPQAITYSIPIGTISGLLFLLPIVFTLPDIPTLLAVPGGQPIGVMFTLIMGSKSGGFGMWFIVFIVGIFCAISICCAASRATWSFARDKAIPGHHFFARISGDALDPSAVPFNAHLLSTAVQLLLGLIYLGSSAAFNAFVGVAVICLGATYAMPIAILLFNGRKEMRDARFTLGRWGFALNVMALLWVSFEIVLFSMPAVVPVNKVMMTSASLNPNLTRRKSVLPMSSIEGRIDEKTGEAKARLQLQAAFRKRCTRMAPINLPLDIVEIILDLLMRENTFESKKALHACACVASALTPLVQRLLFAEISIRGHHATAEFESILITRPQLASYVKTVMISITSLALEDSARLASVIDRLSALSYLSIIPKKPRQTSFLDLHGILRNALLARFQTVVKLRIFSFFDPPMRHILSCTQLKQLELRSPRGTLRDDGHGTAAAQGATCQLDSLFINGLSYLPLFVSQHSLVSLKVQCMPFRDVVPLIRGSQKSLVLLHMDNIWEFELDQYHIDVDLPALAELNISDGLARDGRYLQGSTVIFSLLRSALTILGCGRTTPRQLEDVKIWVWVQDPRAPSLHEMWENFDSVLMQARYKKFKTLTLWVNLARASDSLRDDIGNSILRALPKLNAASKVVLNVFSI
ncbi:hypothetical protein DXG01_012602 [Tephrocybe rancida]|nr:hypothetical protein DXG01_012602 [Tephrocybe rancida]